MTSGMRVGFDRHADVGMLAGGRYWISMAVGLTAWVGGQQAEAHYEIVGVERLAAQADVIFEGVVSRQDVRSWKDGAMQFTDVTFTDVHLKTSRPGAIAPETTELTLSFAGGDRFDVCCVPRFKTGQRYLIAAHYDGKQYASAVVSGAQGSFRIMRDEVTGEDHVLTHGGVAIVGVDADGLPLLAQRPEKIESGLGKYVEEDAADSRMMAAPKALHVGQNGAIPTAKSLRADRRNDQPVIKLSTLVDRLVRGVR